jgi:hypothetical protein
MRFAIQRVDGFCSQIVKSAMVAGRPIKAPGIPYRKSHIKNANSITNGEIASALPVRIGSK